MARYRFGQFLLAPSEHVLLKNEQAVPLALKDFELLVALVTQAGRLLRKEDLLQRLWPDAFVEENNLTKHVSTLRKALGDTGGARFIETVPRVGLRFVAQVTEVPDERPPDVRRMRTAAVAAGLALLAAAAGLLVAQRGMTPAVNDPGLRWTSLAVAALKTRGVDEGVGIGLADAVSARLGAQRFIQVRRAAAGAGADLVLEGEVERVADTMHVHVVLTDVAAARPVWSERFEGRADELFSIEDGIAQRVVSGLRLRLAAEDQQRLRRRYTQNAPAYEAYLRGRASLLHYTPEGTRDAVAAFGRALEHDPGYTLARAGLAMASADMYLRFAAGAESKEWGLRAEREAKTAIDLDPDLAEAHLARAAVFRKQEFDWHAAIAASQRALMLNPNLGQAHLIAAAAYYHLGFMEEALAEMERGRRAGGGDELEAMRVRALVALFSANFNGARLHLEELSARSSTPIADTYLALAIFYSGDARRAGTMLGELTTSPSVSTAARSQAALAGVLAAQGDRPGARRRLEGAMAGSYRDHHVAYGIGAAYAQLGDHARAVEWLQVAARTGFPCVMWYERDPLLVPLRGTGSFDALLAEMHELRRMPSPMTTS